MAYKKKGGWVGQTLANTYYHCQLRSQIPRQSFGFFNLNGGIIIEVENMKAFRVSEDCQAGKVW